MSSFSPIPTGLVCVCVRARVSACKHVHIAEIKHECILQHEILFGVNTQKHIQYTHTYGLFAFFYIVSSRYFVVAFIRSFYFMSTVRFSCILK